VPELRLGRAPWGRRVRTRGDLSRGGGASEAPIGRGRCAVVRSAGQRAGDRMLALCVASLAVVLVVGSRGTAEPFDSTRAAAAAAASAIRTAADPAVWSTRPGTMPPERVRLVMLAAGRQARFVLASTDVTPSPGCRTPYTGKTLQVFPPNRATAIREPYRGSFCNLVVGPVQPDRPQHRTQHSRPRSALRAGSCDLLAKRQVGIVGSAMIVG
jgi:hypothetical protein